MDLTSLSLQWDPVQNASGTPVYLITVNTTGDYSSTYTNVRIYHPEPWKPQGRHCCDKQIPQFPSLKYQIHWETREPDEIKNIGLSSSYS